jgi:hypothetical protein
MPDTEEFLSLSEIAAQIAELEAKLDARYKALREPELAPGSNDRTGPCRALLGVAWVVLRM